MIRDIHKHSELIESMTRTMRVIGNDDDSEPENEDEEGWKEETWEGCK